MTALALSAPTARHALKISTRSCVSDTVWRLDRPPPGANRGNFNLHWDFALGDGESFADAHHGAWCNAAKLFLASLRFDPPAGRRNLGNSSLVSEFGLLRLLIRWMFDTGARSFTDLDADMAQRFLASVASRQGARRRRRIAEPTLHFYGRMLADLHLQGAKYPELACADPFPGVSPTGGRKPPSVPIPHTPDEVALPLVSAALRLIGAPADDVIALQAQAQRAYDDVLAAGVSQTKAGFAVVAAIKDYTFSTLPGEAAPWHGAPVTSTKTVRQLTDRIYDACFVVIAYLIGARVSEILGLQLGCMERRRSANDGEQFAYVVGRIHKTGRGPEGDPHRWVAPAPVERAIAIMEQLSKTLRMRTGRDDLWLVMASTGLAGPKPRVEIPNVNTVLRRLNVLFAPFAGLDLMYRGELWRLTTHQGRKTFARFVGKRDRTGLQALKSHFGHVTRVMTDRFYVGTDFALDELIDRHAQEETKAALEELLTAPRLGGKTGRMIAERSRFRGRTKDGDVSEYVDFLMRETDMRLGVCDWGYCVYRSETSACLGSDKGPNPTLRSESVCATCANFAVTAKHRPVWEARRARNLDHARDSRLDAESRSLADARIKECDRILTQLDQESANAG